MLSKNCRALDQVERRSSPKICHPQAVATQCASPHGKQQRWTFAIWRRDRGLLSQRPSGQKAEQPSGLSVVGGMASTVKLLGHAASTFRGWGLSLAVVRPIHPGLKCLNLARVIYKVRQTLPTWLCWDRKIACWCGGSEERVAVVQILVLSYVSNRPACPESEMKICIS